MALASTIKLSSAYFVHAIAQWLVVIYLARAAGLETAGYYSLALAVASPIFLLNFLGLRTTRAAQGDQPRDGESLVLLRIGGLGIAAFLTLGIFLSVAWVNFETLLLASAVTCFKLAEGICDLVYGENQRTLQFGSMVRSLYLRSSIVGLGLLVGFIIAANPAGVILVTAIASLVWSLARHGGELLAIASDGRVQVNGISAPRPNWATLQKVGLRHLSLGGSAAVSSLGPNIPRYALAYWSGPEAVAIFTLLVYFPMMAQLVVVSMGQTQVAALGSEFRADRPAFRRRTHRMIYSALVVGILLFLGGLTTGEYVLDMLYGAETASYAHVLPLFLAYGVAAFIVAVLHYALIACGRYKKHFIISTAAAVVLGLLVVLSVPSMGLSGAIVSMIAAMLFHAVGAFLIVQTASR